MNWIRIFLDLSILKSKIRSKMTIF